MEIPHGMALDLAWELAEAGRSKSNVDIESAFELGKKSRDAFIPLAMDFRAQRTRPRLRGWGGCSSIEQWFEVGGLRPKGGCFCIYDTQRTD